MKLLIENDADYNISLDFKGSKIDAYETIALCMSRDVIFAEIIMESIIEFIKFKKEQTK